VDFRPGFSVTALTVNIATNLSAQLAISSTAAVGSRRVTVTTAAEVRHAYTNTHLMAGGARITR